MPACVRPAFLTRERVQLRRLAFTNLALASLQNDWQVVDRRRHAGELTCAAGQRVQVPASRLKPELAPAIERFRGARGIEPAKILAGPRKGDMHQAGFVTRPARSAIAESCLQIRKVGARIRTAIHAGLPPKRQPLAGMAIAY